MEAGIHQGGGVFIPDQIYCLYIDSLIIELESSNLCCTINAVSVSPLAYADDIGTACTNKNKVDMTLDAVFTHSRKWRYDFNPKKSAVLVFGETSAQRRQNSKYQTYRLGYHKVEEKLCYDHVGLKDDVTGVNMERIDEKISKGRNSKRLMLPLA